MKTPDYMILINGQNRLPDNFDDPVIAQKITDRGICFEEYWAEKE